MYFTFKIKDDLQDSVLQLHNTAYQVATSAQLGRMICGEGVTGIQAGRLLPVSSGFNPPDVRH